jgi:hypothetical protein
MSSWILYPYDQDREMLTLDTDIPLNVAKLVKGKRGIKYDVLFFTLVLARSKMNLIFSPFNEICNSIDNKYSAYVLFYQY